MNYFVSAIGTDSGKTLASAILTYALSADYWKPVQAGAPTDSDAMAQWISDDTVIFPEQYVLKTPASPHYAAQLDNINIELEDFKIPKTNNDLIIEGAGGLLVPLNEKDKMIDLVHRFKAELILVCNIYLGSINHSLLSLEALQSRGIFLKGIIFNGPDTQSTKHIILKHSKAPCLLDIGEENVIDKKVIIKYGEMLKDKWYELGL